MADWTTTRLNLRYHWKTVLLWGLALLGVGWFVGVAGAHERHPDLCTTKTATIEQPEGDYNRVGEDGNLVYVAPYVERGTLTVTNPCDGLTLHLTVTSLTDEFHLSCWDLRFVQPPGGAYVYGGHGYESQLHDDHWHYVTLHVPGNRAGICHDLRTGETRTFRISVDPERVDNPHQLDFLAPFQVYYGDGDGQLLMTFPTPEANRVTE